MSDILDYLPPEKRTELTMERLALVRAAAQATQRANALQVRLDAIRKDLENLRDFAPEAEGGMLYEAGFDAGVTWAQGAARDALLRDDADACLSPERLAARAMKGAADGV